MYWLLEVAEVADVGQAKPEVLLEFPYGKPEMELLLYALTSCCCLLVTEGGGGIDGGV